MVVRVAQRVELLVDLERLVLEIRERLGLLEWLRFLLAVEVAGEKLHRM
jgi:hypothetical protein